MAQTTGTGTTTSAMEVTSGEASLQADLSVPSDATGVVVFAHGSGSSRQSPRNRHVADTLNDRGLATLLVDLLTPQEDLRDQRTREHRFDIPLLAGRVQDAAEAAASASGVKGLPIGLFGASTGAAAALIAAAQRPDAVQAVVSRGGRPDLADAALENVRCPTLLIVGGRDQTVIGMNRQAQERMTCEVRLEVVPGATHLFEEPGALDSVADVAAEWFRDKLRPTVQT